MLVYMTDNKIISNSQVLYSQGFYLGKSRKLNSVSIILLPPGVRFYSQIVDSWTRATIHMRVTIPVNISRGYKVRRTQFPFCYSNCFTMHKIIGQTLQKTAIRLSNEIKYKM